MYVCPECLTEKFENPPAAPRKLKPCAVCREDKPVQHPIVCTSAEDRAQAVRVCGRRRVRPGEVSVPMREHSEYEFTCECGKEVTSTTAVLTCPHCGRHRDRLERRKQLTVRQQQARKEISELIRATHPGNVGDSAVIARAIARQIQSHLKGATLERIAEMGWNAEYDQ